MKYNINFSGKTAVIVCHDAMFGPPHELRDYMLEHGIKTLLFIGHRNRSLANNPIQSSYFELYKDGHRARRYNSAVIILPEMLAYAKDISMTCIWSLTILKGKIDYFVGLGNLNALAGIILRIVGKAGAVIYYVIDYIPNRFKNRLVNTMYHSLDALCAAQCVTWNYSRSMVQARAKAWKKQFPHQLVVENGIHIRPKAIVPFSRVQKAEIIYLGTLSVQQGAQLIIEALPEIRENNRSIQFSLIGMGPYRSNLERLATDLGVQRSVKFLGYIADPVKMERRLSQAALGVAMYIPEGNFVQYTEPGKVKRYLACGVPVVMTDISPLARRIEQKSCGFRCGYDVKRVARVINSFLADSTKMRAYRKNAVMFAGEYTWERIFTSAFQRTAK